jgi:dTDP-3-amino-3,4,6-trideoxy-alpha-D-glucose transaminase
VTSSSAADTVAVPFIDLPGLDAPLKRRVLVEIERLIDLGAYTNGPAVSAFENSFAEYCQSHACVGLASGLDALRLALLASGIQPGDEVIVPAMTFVATFEAVAQVGAVPVPVDIREGDYGLDPDLTERAIGPRTRAVLPVHLYGQMSDVRRICELAREHDLTVIEDACQAHGAHRDGVVAGKAGLAAAFSFYPSKNLGAMGDAGALVTDDSRLATEVRLLRQHGERRKYRHERAGWTARLDTVQALVLLEKLPYLDSWNAERRRLAEAYTEALGAVDGLVLPTVVAGSEPVWHLYVIRTEAPERLARYLAERGVATGRHYPEPPHLTPAFAGLGHRAGSYPVAERLAGECLSLPLFPGMTTEQQDRVVDAVRSWFGRG